MYHQLSYADALGKSSVLNSKRAETLPILLNRQLCHKQQQCPFHKEILYCQSDSLFWNPISVPLSLLTISESSSTSIFTEMGGNCRIVSSIRGEDRRWIYRDCADHILLRGKGQKCTLWFCVTFPFSMSTGSLLSLNVLNCLKTECRFFLPVYLFTSYCFVL